VLLQVGPVADGMVKRGVSLTTVRKIAQGLAFVIPAACMVACALLTPPTGVAANVPVLVGLLSVGFAFGAWSRAGLYCNHQVCLCAGIQFIVRLLPHCMGF
jgi:ACS family sodium-dependent inorganic phosphate cotransporter